MANWKQLSLMMMTAISLTVWVQTAAHAGPFEDANTAYDQKDYKAEIGRAHV